jgi:hypothetical protein
MGTVLSEHAKALDLISNTTKANKNTKKKCIHEHIWHCSSCCIDRSVHCISPSTFKEKNPLNQSKSVGAAGWPLGSAVFGASITSGPPSSICQLTVPLLVHMHKHRVKCEFSVFSQNLEQWENPLITEQRSSKQSLFYFQCLWHCRHSETIDWKHI